MFKLMKTDFNTGFQMTFANGWTVSVQWGPNNYIADRRCGDKSVNAEIAAWSENDNWYRFENDTVKGWCKPDEVADFMAMIKAKEA